MKTIKWLEREYTLLSEMANHTSIILTFMNNDRGVTNILQFYNHYFQSTGRSELDIAHVSLTPRNLQDLAEKPLGKVAP